VGMKLEEASTGTEVDQSGLSTVGCLVAEEEDGDSPLRNSWCSLVWLAEEDLQAAVTPAGDASARPTFATSGGRKWWTMSAVERHAMGNRARIFSLARQWHVMCLLTFKTEVTGVVGRHASGRWGQCRWSKTASPRSTWRCGRITLAQGRGKTRAWQGTK
jgi:hypothetical protein